MISKRHLAKSFTWRVIGTIDTFIFAWFVTGDLNGTKKQTVEVGAEVTNKSTTVNQLGSKSPTYVPTKATISLVLNPIASRKQVSQQFSLKEYANGSLIKKGMW